jgi:CheY-like chemotaxis protein
MNVQRVFSKINSHHTLTSAKNGQDALNLLKTIETPDLILLDLNMPKMNGIEFLQQIGNDEAMKNIKVFIMTTSEEESDREEAAKYKIAGYIIKPLSFDKFDNPSSSMDSFNLLCDLLKE